MRVLEKQQYINTIVVMGNYKGEFMDIGKGCIIADKWVIGGFKTGIKDINEIELITGDKVEIRGCTADYGYIGTDHNSKFWIYFGSDNGSVGWRLTEKVVKEHKIKVIELQI